MSFEPMKLLDMCWIPRAIPAEFTNARRTGHDGPKILATARNDFIHPSRIHPAGGSGGYNIDTLIEAWELAAWYLELVIMWWLGYDGEYKRRTDPNRWVGVTEKVPWAV